MEKINQSTIKKILKNAQKNPQIQSMINNLQQQQQQQDDSITPKEKLHMKLNRMRNTRSGYSRQQEKYHKKERINDTSVKQNLNNIVGDMNIQEEIKKKNSKLKQFEKKYGQISFDRWTEATNKVNEGKLPMNELVHEKNIIALYDKQHPVVEEHLSDDDDS